MKSFSLSSINSSTHSTNNQVYKIIIWIHFQVIVYAREAQIWCRGVYNKGPQLDLGLFSIESILSSESYPLVGLSGLPKFIVIFFYIHSV